MRELPEIGEKIVTTEAELNRVQVAPRNPERDRQEAIKAMVEDLPPRFSYGRA
jgi:hypothetical protein